MSTTPPPLVHYRGAVLGRSKVRKDVTCALRECRRKIQVGEEAWRPIVEDIRGDVVRYQRLCRGHFKDGGRYE